MRYIQKGSEPSSLTAYRKNKNAYYDGYPYKDDVRACLLRDQGYICGYCMRRINSLESTKIEHVLPQSTLKNDDRAALNYRIMLGVCYGNQKAGRSKKQLTCDASRGNTDLTVNPFDETSIRQIKYKSDGTIYSDNDEINTDLNVTLNLNCNEADTYLIANRKAVLEACKRKLIKEKAKGNWDKKLLEQVLKLYENPDSEGRLIPYSGIAIYYLKKKMGYI